MRQTAIVAYVFFCIVFAMMQIGHGQDVPVLKDQKKMSYNRLEETISILAGLEIASTADYTIFFEEIKL